MARQQAADYDEKRKVITREAAKLFAKKGFDGTSVSELAAACKTSKSLVYHYYTSKESILFAVMNGHMDLLVGVVEQLNERDKPAEDLFYDLSRELLRQYGGASNHQKVLLYELDNLPPTDRKQITAKQRIIIDYTESLLAQLAPKDSDHGRLRAHVMLFFGMLNWTHNWFKPSGAITRDDIADMAASSAINAVINSE